MKRQPKTYILYLGLAALLGGVLLKVFLNTPEGALLRLPYILSGFGTGLTAVGLVNLYRIKLSKGNPEKAKMYEIAEKDERNIRLREKAGYSVWYITLFALAVLSLSLVVLDYITAALISLAVLFLHTLSFFILIAVYSKKI